MNEDLILGLYQKGGFDQKGTLDKFKEDLLSSPELRKGVFDKLGLSAKGTYDQFEKDLAITSPQVIEPLVKFNNAPVGVARPAVMANPGIDNEKLKNYYNASRQEMADTSFVPGPAGRDSFKPPQAVEKSMLNAASATGSDAEVKAAQLLNRQEDVLTAAKTIYATEAGKKKEAYSKNPQIAEVEFGNEALNHYRDNAHLIADRSRERLKIIHGEKYNANEIDKAVNTYGALMIMGRIEDANKFIEKYPELRDDQNLRNVVNANMKLRETTKAQAHLAQNNPEWSKYQQKKQVANMATDALAKSFEEAPDFIGDPAKFGMNASASIMNTVGKWAKNFAVTPGMRDWGRERMDFNPKSSDYQGRAIEEYKKVGAYDVVYDGGEVAYVRDKSGYIVQLDEDKMKAIEKEAKGKESQKRFNPKPFAGQTADVILDMAPIIAITAATGGAGSMLGIAGSTARGVGVVAGSMLQTRGDIMDQMLLHPDISKTEAEMYTLGIGTGIGLISLINPIEARILSKGIPGIVAGNAGKMLNKGMSKGQLAWNITKDVGVAVGAEPLEEIIQEYFQHGALNKIDNDQEGYGRFRNNQAPTGDDLLEIGLVSAAVGLLGGAGDIRFSRNAFVDEALDRALAKPKIMEEYLAGQKDGAESITDPEKKQAALDHIERITDRWESLKTNVASVKGLKPQDRGKLAALIVDSNALESELNGITSAPLIAAKKAEIKDVNDQINEIIAPKVPGAAATPTTTPVVDEDPEDVRRLATKGLGVLSEDDVEVETYDFEEGQDIEDDNRLEGDKKGKIISVNNNLIKPGEAKPSVHSIEIEYEDGTKRTKVIARRTPAETGIRVIGKKEAAPPTPKTKQKFEKGQTVELIDGSIATITDIEDNIGGTPNSIEVELPDGKKQTIISVKKDGSFALTVIDPKDPPPAGAGAVAPEDKAPKPRKNKLSPNIGDKLTGESGAKYTIRGTSEKTGAIQFDTETGARGSWSRDRFEDAVNEGRLTYDDEAATPMPAAKTTPKPAETAKAKDASTPNEADLPEYQPNVRTEVTQTLLDYLADVNQVPRYTGGLKKDGYIEWLQDQGDVGYEVARKLNAPRKALALINEWADTIKKIESKSKSTTDENIKGNVNSKVFYQGIPKTTSFMQGLLDENGNELIQGSLEDVEAFKKKHNIDDSKVEYVDLDKKNPNSLLNKFLNRKLPKSETRSDALENRKKDTLTHKERKRVLLESRSDGLTLDESYEKAGYTKIGQIWVSPDISDAKLEMIPDALWQAMEDAGIGVLSFTNAETVHGVAREQEFDDRTTSEIQLSPHDLEKKGLIHVISHEIGHAVYRTLSADQKKGFETFSAVSPYVQGLQTGVHHSGASNAEENFVENFAADLTARLFGESRFEVQIQYKDLLNTINAKYGEPKKSSKLTTDENIKGEAEKPGQKDDAKSTEKRGKADGKKPKTIRRGRSAKQRREARSKRYDGALTTYVGADPDGIVLQYLLENNIHADVIRDMYGIKLGNKNEEKIQGEIQNRLSLIDNKTSESKTLDELAHEIWEDVPEELNVDISDIKDAIANVLQDFNSREKMERAIIDRFVEKTVDDEIAWMIKTDDDRYARFHAMNFLDQLSEEEIQAIADDEYDFENSPEFQEYMLRGEDVEEEIEEDAEEEDDEDFDPLDDFDSEEAFLRFNGVDIDDYEKAKAKYPDEVLSFQEIHDLPAHEKGKVIRGDDHSLRSLDLPDGSMVRKSTNGEIYTITKLSPSDAKKILNKRKHYFDKDKTYYYTESTETGEVELDYGNDMYQAVSDDHVLKHLADRQVPETDNREDSWRKQFNEEKDPFVKSQILRAVADVAKEQNNINDIIDVLPGMPEESSIAYAIVHKAANRAANAARILEGNFSEHTKETIRHFLKSQETKQDLPPEDPSAEPDYRNAEKLPTTVRELADIEAESQSGLLSGMLLSSVNTGDTFVVAGKNYTVAKKTKPTKSSYDHDHKGYNGTPKNYKGSYTKTSVTIKDDAGNNYTYEIWTDWIQNGDKMLPQIKARGITRSKDPVGQLSRDIEGDITRDLINENNRLHTPSDSFRIIQDVLDKAGEKEAPAPSGKVKVPQFKTYDEAAAWVDKRVEELDMTKEYYAGELEYIADVWPQLDALWKKERGGPTSTPTKAAKRKIRDEKLDAADDEDFALLKKQLKNPNKLTVGGIDPEALATASRIVARRVQMGVYKFADIIEDLYAKMGEDLSEFFDAIKSAYGAYINHQATDEEAEQMDENIRKFTYESLTDKFREDVSDRPKDSQPDRGGRNNQPKTDSSNIPGGNRRTGGSSGGSSSGRGNSTDKETTGGKGNSKLLTPPLGTQSDLFLHPKDPGSGPKTDSPGDADGRGNSTDSSKGPDADGHGNAGIDSGTKKAIGGFKERTRLAKKKQDEVEDVPVVLMDEANIRETLPLLLDEQQDDVIKAEHRFFSPEHKNFAQANGKGMMFTNATGTGKSFVALGIVKRFVKQGKQNILIVAPSQPKLTEWVRDAKLLNLNLTKLTGIKDGGQGFNATTFHNFTVNKELLKRDFDLIIYDESHHVMEDKDGNESSATGVHKMMGNMNERQALDRLQDGHPLWKRQNELMLEYRQIADSKLTPNISTTERQQKIKELELQLDVLKEKQDKVLPAMRQRAKEAVDRTKVVFLSATPFKAIKSLGYTNGFLFDWGNETIVNNKGSRINAEEQFYLKNFGSKWQWKNHRLEPKDPPNEAAVAMQEIAFAEKLMEEGVMSGRPIESNMDYSRDFPKVTGFNSDRFNEAFLSIYNYEHNEFARLRDTAKDVFFNHLYTIPLFESLKTSMSIDRIQKQLDLGRKVVVFHRRRESNVRPPFETIYEGTIAKANEVLMDRISTDKAKEEAVSAINQAEAFKERFADLFDYEQTLNYSPTVEQLKAAFPEITTFLNGDVKKKGEKDAAIKNFNDDNSPIRIIVIQENSGREGISLHDTTGKHQRVLMSMSMPNSTTTALQIEGRIYRIGQESHAVLEYPLLGIDLETAYFGSNLNKRLGTTENLAMGKQSRNLTRSFAEGVLFNSTTDDPHAGQGVGGKEYDKRLESSASPFDEAKLIYASNQKITGRRDQREGEDFYGTPEPLGQKMVHWSDNRVGDHTLEPSAGKGAISMWFPNTVASTAIEPAFDLYSQAQTRTGGSDKKVFNGKFEDHNIINKYDTIVMNPPFGVGGKMAMEHVEKAFKHLRDGGRIVALVPVGQMDKRIEQFLYGTDEKERQLNPNAYLRKRILLPQATFQQQGTQVMTQILIIDKVLDHENAPDNEGTIDLRGSKNINEFFDNIEFTEVPGRIVRSVVETDEETSQQNVESKPVSQGDIIAQITEHKDTRNGAIWHSAGIIAKLSRPEYEKVAAIAKKHGGKYFPFTKTFLFKTKDGAEAFRNEVNGSPQFSMDPLLAPNGKPSNLTPAQHAQVRTPAFKKWFGDWENDPENASKVVDENGEPLVVYHRTKKKDLKVLKAPSFFTREGDMGRGIYFSAHKDLWTKWGDNVVEAFVDIRNPISVQEAYDVAFKNEKNPLLGTKTKLTKMGHDGVFDTPTNDQLMVFEPNQIKSATSNTGTFDPTNNDIRFSLDAAPAIMPDVVNGFYSPLEKIILESKADKLPAKQWIDKFAKGDEAKWTGLTDWLKEKEQFANDVRGKVDIKELRNGKFAVKWNGEDEGATIAWFDTKKEAEDFTKGSVTKSDIQKFLKENRVEIKEVVYGEDQKKENPYGQQSKLERMEDIRNAIRAYPGNYDLDLQMDGDWALTKDGELVDETEEHIPSDIQLYGMQHYELSNWDPDDDGEALDTKYSGYTLPGEKTNYKEVLVTLPSEEFKTFEEFAEDHWGDISDLTENQQRIARKQYDDYYSKTAEGRVGFHSNHWSEVNILTHIRMDTRVDANGDKVLFLEELQSDWAQKGRKEGFKETFLEENANKQRKLELELTKTDKEIDSVLEKMYDLGFPTNPSSNDLRNFYQGNFSTPESRKLNQVLANVKNNTEYDAIKARLDEIHKEELALGEQHKTLIEKRNDLNGDITDNFKAKNRPPQTSSAPFVTDTAAWTKLALKVATKEAVKQGISKIAWTTGEQQAERYDLSKQIKLASASRSHLPDHYNLIVEDRQGFEIYPYKGSGHTVSGQEMEDIVGKELAEKLIEGAEKNKDLPWRSGKENPAFFTVSGLDLKIGGRGMTGYYGDPAKGKTGILGNVAKSMFGEVNTIGLPIPPGFDSESKNTDLKNVAIDTTMVRAGAHDGEFFADITADNFYRVIPGYFQTRKEAIDNAKKVLADINARAGSTSTQHSVTITPALRNQVKTQGLPLFSIQAAEAAEASGNPDKNGPIIIKLRDAGASLEDDMKAFADVWIDLVEKQSKPFINRGLELIKGTEYDTGNPREDLARAIGDRAAKSKRDNKLINWVKAFWTRVGKILKIDVSPEQLQKMTIEEYLDIASTQLKYGNEMYAQLLADGTRKTDTEEAPKDPVSKYEELDAEAAAIRPLSSGKPKVEKPLDPQAKYNLEGRDTEAVGTVVANPKGPTMQALLKSYAGPKRKVLETLVLLFPTLKNAGITVTVHESPDSYANAVIANGGTDSQASRSGGFYHNKEVHINISKPDLKENTALHEAFHPIIRELLTKNKAAFKRFLADIMADPEMRRRYYDEFAQNYTELAGQEDAIGEEILTEASADIVMRRILRNMKDIPDKLFDRILAYIKEVLGDTYGKLADFINDKESFAVFAEGLADAISQGMIVPMNPEIKDNIRTIVGESIQHSKQRAGNLFGGAAQTDLFGLMNNQMTLNQEKATPEALLRQKYFDLGYPAPNGQKSNLNPDQYYQVRTPEFKAWFGDWENDPENASKVVDENGEPLQVYRGDSSGRTVFDDKMTFFSENDYVAGSYSNEDANPEYKAFLNIRTPLNLRADNSKRIAGNDPEAVRLFEEAIDALPDDYEAFKGSGMNLTKAALKTFVIREHNGEKYIDFNAQSAAWEAVSEYAKKNGYDGVLMKDESADKYIQFARSQIVFSPTQIKSATDNTGAFDGNNPDIRFSMDQDIKKSTALKITSKGGQKIWKDAVESGKFWEGVSKLLTPAEIAAIKPLIPDKAIGLMPPQWIAAQLREGPQFSIMPDLVDGFYSPLEKTISEAKSDKLPVKQWVEKFAKGDEAKWTGLTDWLQNQAGSVSKSDILNYLKNNRVNIREVVKSNESADEEAAKITAAKGAAEEDMRTIGRELEGFDIQKDGLEIWRYLPAEQIPIDDERITSVYKKVPEKYIERLEKIEAARRAYDSMVAFDDQFDAEPEDMTKYGQYTLPGKKENYKEVLVTLPERSEPVSYGIRTRDNGRFEVFNEVTGDQILPSFEKREQAEELLSKYMEGPQRRLVRGNFQSNHWDEPNILTHIRMDTRTDANGEKTLFLEEVQSDWAQKGRKQGFNAPPKDNRVFSKEEQSDGSWVVRDASGVVWWHGSTEKRADETIEEFKKTPTRIPEKTGTVPSAPFVTDTVAWTKLSLKVALKEAVKQGATKIAWTTGEQQAERYDLSKQVDSLNYDVKNEYLIAYDRDGNTVIGKHIKESELGDFIGQEVAQKLIDKKANADGEKHLDAVDMKIGGKGMTGYYGDPAENKLGILGNVARRMFGEVGTTIINKPQTDINAREFYENIWLKTENPNAPKFDDLTDIEYDAVVSEYEEFKANERAAKVPSTQHSVTVTPELAKQVKTQGQPSFSVQPSHSEYEARVERIKNELRHDILTNQDYDYEPIIDSLIRKGRLTKEDKDELLGTKRMGEKLGLNPDKMLAALENMAGLRHLHRMDELDDIQIKNANLQEMMDNWSDMKDEAYLDKFSPSTVKDLTNHVIESGKAYPPHVIEELRKLNKDKRPGGVYDVIAVGIAFAELKREAKFYKDLFDKTGDIEANKMLQYIKDAQFELARLAKTNGSYAGLTLGIRSKLIELAGLTYETQILEIEQINKGKAGMNIELTEAHKKEVNRLVNKINALQEDLDKAILNANPVKDKAAAAGKEYTRKMGSSLESRPTMSKEEALEHLRRLRGVRASFSLMLSADKGGPSILDVINELVKIAHMEGATGFKEAVAKVQSYDPSITEQQIYEAILSTTPLAKQKALSEYAKRQAMTRKHVKDIAKVEKMVTDQALDLLRNQKVPDEAKIAEFGRLVRDIEKGIYLLDPENALYAKWMSALEDIKAKYGLAFLNPDPSKDTDQLLGEMINAVQMLKDHKFRQWIEAEEAKLAEQKKIVDAGRISELINEDERNDKKFPTKMNEMVFDEDGNVSDTVEVDFDFGKRDRQIRDAKKELERLKSKFRQKNKYVYAHSIVKGTLGSAMAMIDLSMTGIQGFKMAMTAALRNPKLLKEAFVKSIKAFADEMKKNPGFANEVHHAMTEHNYYAISQAVDLDINSPDSHHFVDEMLSEDDAFDLLDNKLQKKKSKRAIPFKALSKLRRKLKLASNAAFGTYLNVLSFGTFVAYIDKVKKLTTDANNPEGVMPSVRELKIKAREINSATGRTKRAPGFTKGLGYVFWAPRLYLSQAQNVANIIADPINFAAAAIKGDKELTRVYGSRAINSAIFAASTVSLYLLRVWLAKLQCGDNYSRNTDINKPSYLKINCGELTLDPTGNERQWLALGARILAAGDGEPFTDYMGRPVTSRDQIWDLMQYKLNPPVSLLWRGWDVVDFLGRPQIPGDDSFLKWKSRGEILLDHLTPMAGGNVVDIAKAKGLDGPLPKPVSKAAIMAEALLGLGVMRIDAEKEKERDAIEKTERKEKKTETDKKDLGQLRTRMGNMKELQGEFTGAVPTAVETTDYRVSYSGKPYKVFKRTDDPNGDGNKNNDYYTVKTTQTGPNKGKKYFDKVEEEKTKRFK